MNRLDIIKQVKPSAVEVMQDRRLLASLLIAECILISEPYKEITLNNPLRLKDAKTDALLGFDSMEDCFNFFIDSGVIGSNRTNVIGNYNYKSLAKALRLGSQVENSLVEIIESYKLFDIDKEVLQNMYDGKRTVIEINREPFLDQYRVRETFSNKEILKTFDKDEAIAMCKNYYGYSVFNSKGETVFSNALTPEVKAKMELQEKIVSSATPVAGSKIHLNCVNLYATPDSKTPSRAISGDYYISNSKRYNNRYMITNKPEYVGNTNFVVGYINASDRK
jgi:hypothetical protein